MKLDGCKVEAFIMSHDLQKNHGNFFYVNNPSNNLPQLLSTQMLNIENLAKVVRDYTRTVKANQKIEIEIEPLSDLPQRDISGACVWIENDNKYRIYYDKNLNDCWYRFVVCKELMQIYIDATDVDNKSTYDDILMQISELYDAKETILDNNTSFEFSKGVSPEIQAFIMAVDLMVSPEDKTNFYILGKLSDITDIEISPYDLALMCKYPEFIVKLYRKYLEEPSMRTLGLIS